MRSEEYHCMDRNREVTLEFPGGDYIISLKKSTQEITIHVVENAVQILTVSFYWQRIENWHNIKFTDDMEVVEIHSLGINAIYSVVRLKPLYDANLWIPYPLYSSFTIVLGGYNQVIGI